MIKVYLITFLINLPILVCAQQQQLFTEIIFESGTILSGFINDEEQLLSKKKLMFTPQDSPTTLVVLIDSIQEMTVGREENARHYFGYKGIIGASLDELDNNTPNKATQEAILVQALVLGTINLYQHNSRFFTSNGGEITELINEFKEVDQSSRRRKQFKIQLEQLLIDCEEAKEGIRAVKFEETSLQALFSSYNTCDENKRLLYTTKPTKQALSFYALAGGAFTRISRNEDQVINIGTGTFQVRVGVGIKWIISEDDTKALLFEGLYSPFGTLDKQGEIDVKLDYLQFNIAYQSSWQSGESWPYLLAGFRYGVLLNEQRLIGLPDLVMEEQMPGMIIGFGFRKNRFRLGWRYEVDNIGLFFAQAPDYYANTLSMIFAYRL